MKIPITKIQIGERQRDVKDLENLSDLDSMADPEIGLLQPIGVRTLKDGQYELVWGRRRLAKAVALGWTEIEALEKGHVPEARKQEMELVEDIGRRDRSWQDKCRSMYKLFHMKRREKLAIGESWSVRMMEALTGDGKSKINYMIQVGEELVKNPEGESAKAQTYTDALKEIFKRNERLVKAEMEKRRQAVVTTPVIEEESPSEEFVHSMDMTPPQETIIKVHGFNIDFADAKVNRDFTPESFYRVIAYNPDKLAFSNVMDALRRDGVAIFWFDSFTRFQELHTYAFELGWLAMPWPLVWNKIKGGDSKWPYSSNASWGLVMRLNETEWDKTGPSPVVSVIETEPGQLHYHVVSHSLAGAPDNMPVLVLGESANPLAVAVSGHTPVFFESNKLKYEKAVAELTQHYQETVPGAVVQ